MRWMSSSESSQFFLPRFLRSGLYHWVASMSCTLPLRCSGLRLLITQIYVAMPGVVEHVQGQGHDRFEPVVLDDPAADVALALAGIAGEQGAAVVDLGNAAAERRVVLHLGEEVREEKHLAV